MHGQDANGDLPLLLALPRAGFSFFTVIFNLRLPLSTSEHGSSPARMESTMAVRDKRHPSVSAYTILSLEASSQ